MKKLLLFFLVAILAFSAIASGIKFSVLTFYTVDLQSGVYNVWPISYFTIPITNSIGLKMEDYVMGSHKMFKIGSFQFIEPTYWYMTYRNGSVSAYLGKFKSNHTLTRQMYLLRVGGSYNTLTGAEIDFRGFTYDFGARYDLLNSAFGVYTGMKTFNSRMYLYAAQDTKNKDEWHLSTNLDYENTLKDLHLKLWGAAAYNLNVDDPVWETPTFLIGGKASWRNFELSAQFAKQPSPGAAKIWYDFNDPNKAGYPLMDFNSLLTYKVNMQNSIGLISNWNSNISYPLFGVKLSHGDLTLTVGSGDLTGGINGTQYVTLSYSNYFSIPLACFCNSFCFFCYYF